MPWKECSVMDACLRFVARLLEGEAMTDVCREFGVSCKAQAALRLAEPLIGAGGRPGRLDLATSGSEIAARESVRISKSWLSTAPF